MARSALASTRHRRLAAAPLLLALAGCATAAEPGRRPEPAGGESVLSLLDAGDRELVPGAGVAGALGAADFVLPGGERVQAWRLSGRAGDSITVDLASGEFDAYLHVLGPGLERPLTDDDGGGGCNARIGLRFPETGSYLVVVQSFFEGGTGPFSLRASRDAPRPSDERCEMSGVPGMLGAEPQGTLGVGARAVGRLAPDDAPFGEGGRMDVWALRGQPGDSVTLDLRSTDFDALMGVLGPGPDTPLEDDDGGGRCDARISLVLASSEPYTILVTSYGPAGFGEYTLTTSSTPGPPLEGECEGIGTEAVSRPLATLPAEGRTLSIGAAVADSLTSRDRVWDDGTRLRAYLLAGRADECVVVDVGSDSFDPILFVSGPGLDGALSDDDGGEGFDSRLRVTFPEDGEYRVVVNTFEAEATGPFRIGVEPCDRGSG